LIQELRSVLTPPPGVGDITDALLALKGEPKEQRGWKAALRMLCDTGVFMTYLKGLKKMIDDGKLPDQHVEGAREYLALEHVCVEIMSKKSSAAAAMCDFLINIVACATSQKCC